MEKLIPLTIDSFPNGGEKSDTLYVSSPNDPRLQAYKDSLLNYELGKQMEAAVRLNPEYFKIPEGAPAHKIINDGISKTGRGAVDNMNDFPSGYPESEALTKAFNNYRVSGNKSIFPKQYSGYVPEDHTTKDLVTGRGFLEGFGIIKPRTGASLIRLPEWEKPTQPVAYKENKRSDILLGNNQTSGTSYEDSLNIYNQAKARWNEEINLGLHNTQLSYDDLLQSDNLRTKFTDSETKNFSRFGAKHHPSYAYDEPYKTTFLYPKPSGKSSRPKEAPISRNRQFLPSQINTKEAELNPIFNKAPELANKIPNPEVKRQYKEENGKYYMRFFNKQTDKEEWRPITQRTYELGMQSQDEDTNIRYQYENGGLIKLELFQDGGEPKEVIPNGSVFNLMDLWGGFTAKRTEAEINEAIKQGKEVVVREAPPIKAYTPDELIKIKDTRTLHPVTGEAINPNRDLKTGEYRRDIIEPIIKAAKRVGVDPYVALAVSLQETSFGRDDEENPYHLIFRPKKTYKEYLTEAEQLNMTEEEMLNNREFSNFTMALDFASFLKQKMEEGRSKGYTDEASLIQAYNGYGKITSNTEKGYHAQSGRSTNRFYGVDVTKEPLDMAKNPAYGKTVLSFVPILKENEQIRQLVESMNEDGGLIRLQL